MLKKFSLRNFRNFKNDIEINFDQTANYQFNRDCITDDMISKMLIYGRNGTGKTNLGRALMDIKTTLFAIPISSNDNFINADSDEDSAEFSYTFQFDNDEILYQYSRYDNIKLMKEELYINHKQIFKIDYSKAEYDFDNLSYIKADQANINIYLSSLNTEENSTARIPFFRWLISNVVLPPCLNKVADYARSMLMISAANAESKTSKLLFEKLEEKDGVKNLEEFLNHMGLDCKLIMKKLPDGQNELYFEHKKLVPFFSNASSGTIALVKLYFSVILKMKNSSLIYLDEFDAFYHYEMAVQVIKYFKNKFPNCQIIMTSHNTHLMTNRYIRPDCLFILSRTGTLTALCNATSRELREGHNLEKMYISGEFEMYE